MNIRNDRKAKYREILRTIPSDVTLVAATKGRSIEEIMDAIDVGIRIIGENYVQEAEKKYEAIANTGAKFHMIGHLQRNKVKDALRIFDCIQSVDSLRLARELDKQCAKLGKVQPILIEVNISGEETKHGINPDETMDILRQISDCPNLRVEGLMMMEPYSDDLESVRPYFRRMKQLFDEMRSYSLPNVELKILSMGMSNSYEVAIEEGSNMVRIGTKLFGPRNY